VIAELKASWRDISQIGLRLAKADPMPNISFNTDALKRAGYLQRFQMLRPATLSVISAYQRYISPHKGFSCAMRVYAGRCSCSEFARRVVHKHGVLRLLRLLPKRFDRCRLAYLRFLAADKEEKNSGSTGNPGFCCREGAGFTVGCCPWP
jgi:putative component of membrane protein insertase Oxa1/YidC/SpoIIIJ protein YidD